jgi:hypothetical protein
MSRIFVAAFSLVFINVAAALAASPLAGDQVARFVDTLEPVQGMADRLEKDGKTDVLKANQQPTLGKSFKPYSDGVAALKKTLPGEHAELAGIVKSHGFTTEQWAAVGDRVILAYMAIKMEDEQPGAMAQMAQMDPAMLDMMPPEMRDQMAGAMAMMQAIQDVPEDDKTAVRGSKPKLDAYMAQSAN